MGSHLVWFIEEVLYALGKAANDPKGISQYVQPKD